MDNISNPSDFLKKIIPEYSNSDTLPKLETAQKIAKHLNLNNNKSESFNQMVKAIKDLTNKKSTKFRC